MHEVTFLGHKCTDKGVLPDDKKFEVIKNYPVLHDADSARLFVAIIILQLLSSIYKKLRRLFTAHNQIM